MDMSESSPTTGAATSGLPDETLETLSDVMKSFMRGGDTLRVRRRVARRAGLDLDGPGLMLLDAIHTLDAPRLSDLATKSYLDLSVVSRQIRHLEQAGFVERQPDPDDARASRVHLTETGGAALQRLAEARLDMLRQLFSDWNAHDVDTFTNLLRRHSADFTRLAATQ